MLTPTRWPLHCATLAGHLHRHAHPQRSVLSAYLVSLLVAAACHDQGPTTGSLRITVNTTGGDLDLDGYALTIDAAAPMVRAYPSRSRSPPVVFTVIRREPVVGPWS